ncbi:inner nuclear membrane protein Man1-like [Montipora capricornis]|uniref:inner nuclear membrane protein Man1-like n=1 Tax=Montipora capricornis TaxID=246305 RepID=UPI0035F1C9E7
MCNLSKMAAKYGDISDDELRRQLTALGEDVGPVTPTTRSFLLRKLKRLQNEGRSTRASKENTPSRRGTSPGRKSRSSPALSRNQSPSRRLIGFSSDEEDGGPSHSSTFIESSKSRGRRKEAADNRADHDPPEESEKTKPSLLKRRSYQRQRVPSFIESAPERTIDSTDGNIGEFSDQDGQVYRHVMGKPWPSTKRASDENEISQTMRVSSTYDNKETVTVDSKLNSSLREGQAGAKVLKGGSLLSSTRKIVLVISGICIAVLLYAALKWLSSDPQPQLEELAKLPICRGKSVVDYSHVKPPRCISLYNISQHYAVSLHKELSAKAGLCECEYFGSRNLSLDAFIEQIRKDKYNRTKEEQTLILNETLGLILKTPAWNLRLFDENNELTDDIKKVKWIDCSIAMKPLFCRIKEAISRLAYLSFFIGFVIGSLVIFYFIVRQRWRSDEAETRMMYPFVEKIIDILREHHEASKTEKNLLPYLPIPHVRDMLIPPSDRQRLIGAWNRAVRFLSGNESRIRVESQRIAGEDFEVWRWIQVATPKAHSPKLSRSGNKRGKYWQGQAFENFQSAVNPPVISPTPCLKIRNMFDPDVETEDGWHVMIQDAILEKCIENGAGVVHIAVDKSSVEGCVYVKCDTHHSAGLAFRSLHGCWFDGRLVAVKYLTLKRYHQRFPVALEATERLNPSGFSPSSLVTFDPASGDEDINDSDIEL